MTPTRPASRADFAGAAALGVALFVLALLLFTRNNDFPFYYHPDEPGKVDQVLLHDYNFHHPLLMLQSVELLLHGAASKLDSQKVVETGRLVSAIFGAIAVAAFALLAWIRSGWLASLATGLLLVFNQQLFELVHYMKEDPTLLAGVALTFLALAFYQHWRGWHSALACGAACGVAVSGKYVGAVLMAFVIPVLWLARFDRTRRLSWLAVFLAGVVVVLGIVNLPLLRNLSIFEASFGHEMQMVVSGSKGMTRHVPHTIYLHILVDNTTPAVWLALAAFYFCFWLNRREQDAASWAIALFPILFLVMLSFSPKTNDRYFLPVTAVLSYLAALGAIAAATVLLPRWKPALEKHRMPIGVGFLVILLGSELPGFFDVYKAFKHDDRKELIAFVLHSLPANAKIAQDTRVELPDPVNRKRHRGLENPLTQTVVSGDRYAATLGSLEELRAKGFTHVAVSESNYGRFFLDSLKPLDSYRDDYAQFRGFYEQLFRESKPLFERPRSTVIYLHPGLKLYRIAPPQL